MDEKKDVKKKAVSKSKEKDVNAKAFSKVDSKEKVGDMFANVEENTKPTKTNKNKKEEVIKGTITIDKKVEEKVKKEKPKKVKSKNAGKWVGLVIAIVLIVAIALGIVFFLKTPYFVVMKTFNSLKSENIQSINEYMSYQELIDSLVKSVTVGDEMSDLEKNCFVDFTFKINTVKVEGDAATVNVDTTNKNFRNALTKWNQKIYQMFINGEEISNKQGITILNDCLSDQSIGTITTNKDITLNKVDGKWKIVVNTNLQDAVFPGRSELANSIDALIGE